MLSPNPRTASALSSPPALNRPLRSDRRPSKSDDVSRWMICLEPPPTTDKSNHAHHLDDRQAVDYLSQSIDVLPKCQSVIMLAVSRRGAPNMPQIPLIPRIMATLATLRADSAQPYSPTDDTRDSGAPVSPTVYADAWQNAASGLGMAAFDRATQMTFGASAAVGRHTLGELYRYDGIAAKIIDLPVWDSVRNGWSVDIQGDEESPDETIDAEMADALAPLMLREVYSEARKWARLYGTALVIAGLDDVDAGDLSQPVERYGTVKWLEVVAAGCGGPVTREHGNPADRSEVTMWVINPQGQHATVRRVHPSRVYLVRGIPLPAELSAGNGYWDDSVIQRVWTALQRVATADGTGVTFLSERQYPVWKIKNLKAMLSGKNGGLVGPRFQAMSVAKSIYKAIILDAGNEEYDVIESPATGIVELLNLYPNRVSAVSNIPVTRLYGTSPGGLNATGDSDIRGYYDFIEGGEQVEHLAPFLTWVTELVLEGDEGPTRGQLVPFTVNFNPLWSPTAAEIATTRGTNATTDIAYINIGVLSEGEVRASRFGGSEYGSEITIDHALDVAPMGVTETAGVMAEASGLALPTVSPAASVEPVSALDPPVGVPEAATILNAAQISSLLSVTAQVTAGATPPEVAYQALTLLGVAPDTARSMVDASAAFTPKPTPETP